MQVHSKLKQLHEDGFKLLIISNQNGIEAKKTTVQQFQVNSWKFNTFLLLSCFLKINYRLPI